MSRIPADDYYRLLIFAASKSLQLVLQTPSRFIFNFLPIKTMLTWNKLVESLGADATYSHRLPLEDQLKEIASITGGKFSRVFDASAFGAETGIAALVKHADPNAKPKYFSTTNDW